MSHFMIRGVAGGGMLLLVAATTAQPQVPHTQSRTSAVQQLNLDSSRTTSVTGRMRELKCRGKPGIDMRVHQDPSPRQPDQVTMVLRYERLKVVHSSLRQVGMGVVDDGMSVQFQPGGCTWGGTREDGFLSEPGIVYFDLPRDAQTHAARGARDTTIEAAAHFPDVTSLPRFMSDSSRFWVFYVDDVTNVSISFGRWPLGGAAPTVESVSGSLREASPTLSSAHVITADSAARRPTVAQKTRTTTAATRTAPAQTPAPAGSVGGPLRPGAAGAATSTPAAALPTDSAVRRSGTVRSPLPSPSVDGPLPEPGAESRAMPMDTAAKLPDEARARSPRIAARRLSNVRTAPGPLGVVITFYAAGLPLFNPHNHVRVEIEFEPPAWNARERRWAYPTGLGGHWFAKVDGATDGGLRAVPWSKLEPGRRYHYLITAFARGEFPEDQRTGSFIAEIRTPLNGLFSK